jgi:type IV pilus assembly protein PilM
MDFKKILKDTLTIKFDKAFGLDIGDRSVEIVELEKVFRYSVVTYGRVELPEGIIEEGKILNANVLAENVKNLLKEAKPKKVSTNKVILSLPESQVFTKCFEVEAGLKSTALTQAIMSKVNLAMPIDVDKTYWDFIEKPLPDKARKLIMFFCVPRDIANSYVKFCNSIGLEVVSLNIESLSLARVILKGSNRQSLILDIGSRATNLSFFDSNDRLNMTSTIPVAGEQMTLAIKHKLVIENIDAENLKIKFGFSDEAENTVKPIILPILEEILKETKEAIKYYEETFGQTLDDIYITGGSALLPGIVNVIKINLGREVVLATSAHSLNLNLLAEKSNYLPLFSGVIGLGMLGASGEFKDMNLLKKMPGSEVNSVDKINLLNMGYLSKVNTFRTIINNKYVLVILVILIGVIFVILLRQTENFGVVETPVAPKTVAPVRAKLPIRYGTSTLPISTSTPTSTPVGVATSVPFIPVPVKPVTNVNNTPQIVATTSTSINYFFTEDKDPGSYGEAVTKLQERLTKEGYFNGLVGGFFGPATEQALRAYQQAKGIAVTGKLDAVTRGKLNGQPF